MSVSINEKGNLVVEFNRHGAAEVLLDRRRAIIESMQAQDKDMVTEGTNYHLLDLLLDMEPSFEQTKKMLAIEKRVVHK